MNFEIKHLQPYRHADFNTRKAERRAKYEAKINTARPLDETDLRVERAAQPRRAVAK
jgi:hypothetical protein